MAQSKTPKDKNTAMFLVVVLLLTLVGAGTGICRRIADPAGGGCC